MRCTKCGEEKGEENFPTSRQRPCGYSSWCYGCHRRLGRERAARKRALVPDGESPVVLVTGAVTDRFWARVDRSGGPDACWPFLGNKNRKGYGRFNVQLQNVPAHRVAFVLSGGSFENGPCVLHSCDTPSCCNPAHLSSGTKAENNRQAGERGRWIGKGARVPEGDIDVVLARLASGETQASVAASYGASQSTISRIAGGERRRRVKP